MVIKIGKKFVITLTTLLIIAVVYNIIFFVLPWHLKVSPEAAYVTYGCTWGALVFAGICTAIAFKNEDLKSKVFGMPILCVAATVMLLQLVIDIVVVGVGSWFVISFWMPLIAEVLLFGFGIVSLMIRDAYRDVINNIDSKDEVKKSFIKELRIRINSLNNSNTIEVIKPKLEKLNETIKFTSPISSSDVVDIENQIIDEFALLERVIGLGDADSADKQIDKLLNLLIERKTRLMSK